MIRVPTGLVFLVLATACQGGSTAPAQGGCTPTVAGGPAPNYADYEAGRKAFTRQSDGEVLTATLEDAAWLRYEGSPDAVQRAHRAYFEYGYTSFQVVLRAHEFTQPTKETFTLQDSRGGRVAGRPLAYQGSMKLADGRWQYSFALSFEHTITKDTRWLSLTRDSDGATIRWDFN